MNKFFFVLIAIVVFPLTALAEFDLLEGKVKIAAQGRVRFEFFNNTDFVGANDTRDYILTRIRPSLTLTPHEQLSIVFEPQFTGGWGETGASLTTINSTTAGTTTSVGAALNDPALGLHQGYLLYAPAGWFSMALGRQELNYGDQLIIGNVDWNIVGRSFDAAKFKFSGDGFWIDAIYSLLSDGESGMGRGVATGSLGDAHFMGVYSSLDLGEHFKEVDLYALYRLDQTARPRPHSYVTSGLRIKAKPSAWDYRFEGTGQYGKLAGANQRDFQIDLEGGHTWEDFYNFRVALEGFVTSKNYNQLFPTAHKWLGYIDLFGRRNIMGGALHLSMVPAEKWRLALDAHTFFRTSAAAGLFNLAGTTAIGAAGASTSRFAGEEIDLTVNYKPLKFLGFQAGTSFMIPAGFIRTNVGTSLPVFGYLQAQASF